MPSTRTRELDAILAALRERHPGFALVAKEDSRLMRFLGATWGRVNRGFTHYVVTAYPRVYIPSSLLCIGCEDELARTLAHEGIHLEQQKRLGLARFLLGYFFPQWLSALSLLTIPACFVFGAWGLVGLAFLLALLPWPSPARVQHEVEAYCLGIAVDAWRLGYGTELLGNGIWSLADSVDSVTKTLSGVGYYYASWQQAALWKRVSAQAWDTIRLRHNDPWHAAVYMAVTNKR